MGNATLGTDGLNRQTADSRYYSNTLTLDHILDPTDSVTFNNQKLTGLGDATLATDALNRQTGDSRYYSNTTTLNNITAPNGDLSLNSHKITGLSNGSLSTDAVAYGQLSGYLPTTTNINNLAT